MPQLSEKGRLMPASPIRKLVPYADAAKKRGIKVYHLNIGQPDIETPEVALEAVRNYTGKIIEYSHSAGNASYREGLAKYYQTINPAITAADILITNGGSEALQIAIMACLNPGDEIIIPEPFYTNYSAFALQAGVKVVPIGTSIENNFACPTVEEYEKLITDRTKAIMVGNPHNPTGHLYTQQEMDNLREVVLKHDLFVFADEVYREFCYDEDIALSCLNMEGCEENVIVIDSVSKRYSMCGVRVGAIVSRNKELISSALRFGQARLCPPFYGQLAGEAALKTPASYFKKVKDEYIARRNYLVNALNEIPGVYSPMPCGAFYTVVKLPIDDCETFAKWLLEEFSYNGETVMVAPAKGFYASTDKGQNEVRMAYVLNVEDLKHAVKCLEEALKVYPGRTI